MHWWIRRSNEVRSEATTKCCPVLLSCSAFFTAPTVNEVIRDYSRHMEAACKLLCGSGAVQGLDQSVPELLRLKKPVRHLSLARGAGTSFLWGEVSSDHRLPQLPHSYRAELHQSASIAQRR